MMFSRSFDCPEGWENITDLTSYNNAIARSESEAIVLFKHSTRCPISSNALRRLTQFEGALPPMYYLDLIEYRTISNHIAETLKVQHQSPQFIAVFKGKVVDHASHEQITALRVSNVVVKS